MNATETVYVVRHVDGTYRTASGNPKSYGPLRRAKLYVTEEAAREECGVGESVHRLSEVFNTK